MIVSNPPYIRTDVCGELDPEVKDHEPMMALDGREDGLYFERKIAEDARAFLKKGAWIFMEIGYDQGDAMRGILQECGYRDVRIVRDLGGNDRVAMGRTGD
jgi:release factor glutamine methyltransferase